MITCKGLPLGWFNCLAVLLFAGAGVMKAVQGDWGAAALALVATAITLDATPRWVHQVTLVDDSTLVFRTIRGELRLDVGDVKAVYAQPFHQITWYFHNRRVLRLILEGDTSLRSLSQKLTAANPYIDVRLGKHAL